MAAETEARPVPVRVAHEIPGRLRLRLERHADRADPAALADRIAACTGVHRVAVRPATGSVIVEGETGEGALRAALEAGGAVKVLPPAGTLPVAVVAKAGLDRLDREIGDRTDGALDHRSALAVLLLGAAAVQVARGQLVGPAATLLVGALSLLEPRPR